MPGSWLYASSRTGYIDSEIYEEWFQKIFLPNSQATADHPVLLIVDGHESHINYRVAKSAIENNVTIMVEPPHASHFLQPADMIFRYLKNEFSDQCQSANMIVQSAQVGIHIIKPPS